jgi:membrane protease subunit HflK
VASAWTSYYTIPAESEGVVLRFGQYIKKVPSGLHFKLPLGIDRVIAVPTQRQLKQEFGFATPGYTNPDQVGPEPTKEKSMVTGDLNSVLVEWIVQYRIAEPEQYLFAVREPGQTLHDISESVMREVVGDRTVDEVITIGRQDIEIITLNQIREMAKRYHLGVSIDQVQLKNVNPPEPVQASFNEVNKAQQDRENLINMANGEYNKVVPARAARQTRKCVQRRVTGLNGSTRPRATSRRSMRCLSNTSGRGGHPDSDLPRNARRGPPPGGAGDHRR